MSLFDETAEVLRCDNNKTTGEEEHEEDKWMSGVKDVGGGGWNELYVLVYVRVYIIEI